jgi:putative oxidoreductase
MQRLFIMFPAGLPGLALALLRVSVALALCGDDFMHRHDLNAWIQAPVIAVAVILIAGSWTPVLAVAGLLVHGAVWSHFGGVSLVVVSVVTLDAVALSLLGPGAYSLDAVRFGRRVVVLPPS